MDLMEEENHQKAENGEIANNQKVIFSTCHKKSNGATQLVAEKTGGFVGR